MRTQLSTCAALISIVGLVACGGDDSSEDGNGGTDANTDAQADANTSNVVAGLLAITDVTLTNPELVGLGLTGAQVSVSFVDNSTVTVAPLPGYDNPVGGCLITEYDVAAGETEPPILDGGDITVAGTNAGDFTCSFAQSQYTCTLDNNAASGSVGNGSTVTAAGATANYSIAGADFSGVDMRGTHVVINGFDAPEANGTFACLGDDDAQTLVLANDDPAADGATAAAGTFTGLIGAGPVPNGFDFLDDGTNTIAVEKGVLGDVPALDVDLMANGEGLTLDAASGSLPHAMAIDGSAVTFTCGAGTNPCGPTGGGLLNGMTVSGFTTDASVDGLAPNDMPDPQSRLVTFRCSAIGQTSATLDAGAMEAILGATSASPTTRIQTSVSYVAGAAVGGINVVAGHNLTGWIDVVIPQ